MLTTLSIVNYRSILDLTLSLEQCNVISGANGCGKSNLYKALRLLASTAQGGCSSSIANEGGLSSTFWAGPEELSRAMANGQVPIQGTANPRSKRLKLGFSSEQFGYSVSFGLPEPISPPSAFFLDPEIKHECIFHGAYYRPAGCLVERDNSMIRSRDGRSWQVLSTHIEMYNSMFEQVGLSVDAPEVYQVKEMIKDWRFYDHFRTDRDAPARQVQLGTRTPVLSHDGSDLAAALQTIIEIGDDEALAHAIDDAFPGASLKVVSEGEGYFSLAFYQEGLLRPLTAAELSDGTLRFILWIAALLTPRPPSLMVLNEPETSLHPDLIPALARLIEHASHYSQVWVITHSTQMITRLKASKGGCNHIELEKVLGETKIADQGMFDTPNWHWPKG